MGFSQSDFPRRTGVLDRRERTGPGAAIFARNGDMIGMGFSDSGRYSADPDFRNQLNADVGLGIDVFQVKNQLR